MCDSPSRSLFKIRNDENDSQNDEMGTRRSIRFLSESQTSQLSINDKTEVEEEKMDVNMESGNFRNLFFSISKNKFFFHFVCVFYTSF